MKYRSFLTKTSAAFVLTITLLLGSCHSFDPFPHPHGGPRGGRDRHDRGWDRGDRGWDRGDRHGGWRGDRGHPGRW